MSSRRHQCPWSGLRPEAVLGDLTSDGGGKQQPPQWLAASAGCLSVELPKEYPQCLSHRAGECGVKIQDKSESSVTAVCTILEKVPFFC